MRLRMAAFMLPPALLIPDLMEFRTSSALSNQDVGQPTLISHWLTERSMKELRSCEMSAAIPRLNSKSTCPSDPEKLSPCGPPVEMVVLPGRP
jgi:hypothetical protein